MVIAENIHPHHGIILKFWQIVLLKTKMMTNKIKFVYSSILLFKYVNVVLLELYKYTK